MLLRDKVIELSNCLSKIANAKKRFPTDEKIITIENEINQALEIAQTKSRQLIMQLNELDQAEIVIRGKAFPGVYIEICHVAFILSHELTNVRFKLDKAKGKVVYESLKA